MRRIAVTLATASLVASAAVAGAVPAFAARTGPARHHQAAPAQRTYYLALGDSLSQGVQPNPAGVDVETRQGYPDQLYTALKITSPNLRLVKLGCPGETTTTMIKGGICTYPDGSQLAQAAAFLKAHQGKVQLVTIDIGANDLNPCVVLTSITKIVKCLEKVIPVTEKNLAQIMATLRAATATPVAIIGMNYYVPELAGWLKGTKAARTLAKDSVLLGKVFGDDLAAVYTKYQAKVANVYAAFHTGQFKPRVILPPFGKVPRDVAYICAYTWECAAPPRGPNEHANRLGYAVIASAFLQAILG
jgi:lysophospholipase L1-like esterase